GINRRLLDPVVRTARVAWLRGLVGRTGPAVALRRSAQDRRPRRPVDSAAALLRFAATVVAARRFDHGLAWLSPAEADADPLRRQPHPARAESPRADERQTDGGGVRRHGLDGAADHRRDPGGRTRSQVQERRGDARQGPGGDLAARTPLRLAASLRPL